MEVRGPMIKQLIQTSLDDVLYPKGIYVFEQRKSGHDLDEYIVYTMSGDIREEYIDDKVVIKNANVTIKYYYRTDYMDNYEDKMHVREIEDLIETTLEDAGLEIPFGKFDGGDIDDIGYFTTIFECEWWRAV